MYIQGSEGTFRKQAVRTFLNSASRALAATILPSVMIFGGGCVSDNNSTSRSGTAPASVAGDKLVPSTNVSRVQAWKDAEMVASMGEGRAAAAGSGGSMQPVFGDNTMIVISKIAYEDLQPGMTVAYVNRRGHQVVHQLIEKQATGWRVQGLNNETEDLEQVTRENLVGVIYASFAAEEP